MQSPTPAVCWLVREGRELNVIGEPPSMASAGEKRSEEAEAEETKVMHKFRHGANKTTYTFMVGLWLTCGFALFQQPGLTGNTWSL